MNKLTERGNLGELVRAPILIALLFALLSNIAQATAQEIGDIETGRQFAKANCQECHSIEPNDPFSSNPFAPTFSEVAHTSGMTAWALSVWFRSPHPTMPNLIINDDQKADIIAYILSLKSDDS